TCSNPKPNSCAFYDDCLEDECQCGADGYPIGYGLHYCEEFTDAKSQMSDAGKDWVAETMLCLQNELVPWATGSRTGSCTQLKEYAFGTHPECYVNSGLCTLPPTDWIVVVQTVGLQELFGSWGALKASLQAAQGCGKFLAFLVERSIVE
ncbi:hypothetical protein BDY21DRAFT_266411, partial [Lineolata rhizophorae]